MGKRFVTERYSKNGEWNYDNFITYGKLTSLVKKDHGTISWGEYDLGKPNMKRKLKSIAKKAIRRFFKKETEREMLE